MNKRNQLLLFTALFFISIHLYTVYNDYSSKYRVIESKKELKELEGFHYKELDNYFGIDITNLISSNNLSKDQKIKDGNILFISESYYIHQEGYCDLYFQFYGDKVEKAWIDETDTSLTSDRDKSFLYCLNNHIERNIKSLVHYKGWKFQKNEKKRLFFSVLLAIIVASIIVYLVFPRLTSFNKYWKYAVIFCGIIISLIFMALFQYILDHHFDSDNKNSPIENQHNPVNYEKVKTEKKGVKELSLKELVNNELDGKAVNQLRIINEKSDISFKLINGEITWDYPAKLNDEAIHSFIHRLDQYFLTPTEVSTGKLSNLVTISISNAQNQTFIMDCFQATTQNESRLVKINNKLYILREKGIVGVPLTTLELSSKESLQVLNYIDACVKEIKFISATSKLKTHTIDYNEVKEKGLNNINYNKQIEGTPSDIGELIANVEIFSDGCTGVKTSKEKHKYYQRISDGVVDKNYLYVYANEFFYLAQYYSFDRIIHDF